MSLMGVTRIFGACSPGLGHQKGEIMSADNYIEIIRRADGLYYGHMQCASVRTDMGLKTLQFVADSIDDAVQKAQNIQPLEYGYRFIL